MRAVIDVVPLKQAGDDRTRTELSIFDGILIYFRHVALQSTDPLAEVLPGTSW